MSQVGAMFLANPSLLNKKPTTVGSKLAALQSLPGITPAHACAAVAAMPSLLNLKPDRLASRWQQLQQVRRGESRGGCILQPYTGMGEGPPKCTWVLNILLCASEGDSS